ncbi:MAG: Crp/Fnr family transcriptional regulator [Candidatus Latescibacterota bacterium]
MDRASRSGIDRREKLSQSLPMGDNRRTGPDRRYTIRRHVQIIEILQKIPLFRGLSVQQFKKVLYICARRIFTEDEVLFHAGDESWEIYILLRGALKVTFGDGKELSRIDPIGIVGEMGVFTGQRRSATTVAAAPSILISIHKMELLKLFRHDADLGIRVLLNVILDLSAKLRRDNDIIEDLKQLCPPGASTEIISGKSKGKK